MNRLLLLVALFSFIGCEADKDVASKDPAEPKVSEKVAVDIAPAKSVSAAAASDEPAGFAWTATDGSTKQLADYKGKVVLLNFWATWCGPCNREIPDLVSLQEKYRGQLQIISIVDAETRDEFSAVVAAKKINYPVVIDSKQELIEKYDVNAYPTTLFVGRDGKISERVLGSLNEEKFAEKLKPLLEQKLSDRR